VRLYCSRDSERHRGRILSNDQVRPLLLPSPAPLHINGRPYPSGRIALWDERVLSTYHMANHPSHRLDGEPALWAMTSPSSQPSGFAAYFSGTATSSSSSTPFVHDLTSLSTTDSPIDTKQDFGKVTISKSPVPGSNGTNVPSSASTTSTPVQKKALDKSAWTKRAWKLTHDPELHPEGSLGRSRHREIRQNGQGVRSISSRAERML
jgi:hypothetical protein